MQKIFKRIALLTMVAVAILCAGIFASACTDKSTDYTITVYYSDGTTAVDGTKDELEVQICVADGGCYSPTQKVDANGVAKYGKADVDEFFKVFNPDSYVIHIYAGRDQLNTQGGEVTISKSDSSVKVVLSDRTAP